VCFPCARWQSNGKKGGKGGQKGGVPTARGGSEPKPSGGKGAASAAKGGTGIDGDLVMTLREVGKTLPGGRILFANVSLGFTRGAKIGVLGLNGAGKSSLLKIFAGLDTEFDGSMWQQPGSHVGYLSQEPVLDASKSVHENIMDGLAPITADLVRFDEISAAMGEPDADIDALLAEQAQVQGAIEKVDGWNLGPRVAMAKLALRVAPDGANVMELSGGERRRVALCRLLLEAPAILLLDEPTNHLDASSVAWLERFLAAYRGTVLAVTHDRYFLDNVAGWILEVDRGAAYAYAGNYSSWLQKKGARLDAEKKADTKRSKAMEAELEWIRAGPKARQAKSKARIARFEAMSAGIAEEKGATKFLSGAVIIPPGPRLGDQVVTFENVCYTTPDGRRVLNNASFALPRGALVGIIGPNGAGKTTLLKLVTRELKPDSGSIVIGSTVAMTLVTQAREGLDGSIRVIDAVLEGTDSIRIGETTIPGRQYLASFNLVGETQTKLVRSLSGGERNRVHLARALKHGANLLLLDEPTNDLDVDTLRSLEDALSGESYDGCALVVSHDRFFLDRCATHTLVVHPTGAVQWFDGSYSDYADWAAREVAEGRGAGLYVLPGSGGGGASGAAVDTAAGLSKGGASAAAMAAATMR
jgi:sulfate-transporting ATPase